MQSSLLNTVTLKTGESTTFDGTAEIRIKNDSSSITGKFTVQCPNVPLVDYSIQPSEEKHIGIPIGSTKFTNTGTTDLTLSKFPDMQQPVAKTQLGKAYNSFPVGDSIGDGAGKTNSVKFRNCGDRIGQYKLKVGTLAFKSYELRANETRKHDINQQVWNARNSGKVDLEYKRDNR